MKTNWSKTRRLLRRLNFGPTRIAIKEEKMKRRPGAQTGLSCIKKLAGKKPFIRKPVTTTKKESDRKRSGTVKFW
jgi:hypothetical protein